MSSLGHTILGDRFYGNAKEISLADKLQLHARQLVINHPKNGKKITFEVLSPF
jgi:tRNA pseudouridine32 synthase/23S rRNA pseudouridine746 synthase